MKDESGKANESKNPSKLTTRYVKSSDLKWLDVPSYELPASEVFFSQIVLAAMKTHD